MTARLTTERLHLRPFRAADLPALIPIYGDAAVMAIRKLGVQTPAQTEQQLIEIIDHWRHHGFGLWAVISREDGGLLGECGLRYRGKDGQVEISYGMAQSAWGRGLATEAALAALDHGFRVVGLGEVVAIAKTSNLASHRVMKKLGMHLAATWSRDGIGRVEYLIRAEEFVMNPQTRISHA